LQPNLKSNVKKLNAYDIDVYGLKDKQYAYEFESDSTFFEALEQDFISAGTCKTTVVLDKSSTMLMLEFNITGKVTLTCDRSLALFEEPVEAHEKLILKFGDHNEELADNIELIRQDTVKINVARYIFEYIALALPMKRLHPSLRSEQDNKDEIVLVFSTDRTVEAEPQKNETIDPRWAALKSIKDL
jgi:uncharacterized metal-binding protein YceD (DUF177 family)